MTEANSTEEKAALNKALEKSAPIVFLLSGIGVLAQLFVITQSLWHGLGVGSLLVLAFIGAAIRGGGIIVYGCIGLWAMFAAQDEWGLCWPISLLLLAPPIPVLYGGYAFTVFKQKYFPKRP